jgi:hypothetical protein
MPRSGFFSFLIIAFCLLRVEGDAHDDEGA